MILFLIATFLFATNGGTPVPVEDFSYDGTGNRLSSHLSSLYLSDNHNRLSEDADYTYAYDNKGNRVSRTAKSGGVVEEYAYDSQNRLVGYSSATSSASYTYDAMDRRIAKTVDGVTTAYIYDASSDMGLATDDILLEFQRDILTRRWLHTDAVDEPVGFEIYTNTSGAGSGAVHEVFADRQGSVITIADPVSGTIKAAYTYDSFGGLAQISGTVQQPYGYTGREFDAESGLYHYRARTYDPATGMFLQSDPIGFKGGDLNTYAYVGNDPFGWGDPSGLSESLGMLMTSKGEDKQRKSVLPNTAYGIGSATAWIANMLGVAVQDIGKFIDLPEGVRNYHPGAGSSSSDLGQNDPLCITAREQVRLIKARVRALGGACVEARDRLNYARARAWRQEAIARQTRDMVCPMDPTYLMSLGKQGFTPVGEWVAKANAFGHAARCQAILTLYGR